MLIAGFPAGSFQANCYLLASAAGADCLVVDPGENAIEPLQQLLTEHALTPVAVLLTHGHLDHIASAAEFCRSAEIPAYLHADDQHLMDDPMSGLNDSIRAMLDGMALDDLRPPEVRGLDGGLELAGLRLAVDHTPGHTPGSVVFRIAAGSDAEGGANGKGGAGAGGPEVLLTGDTLFAGSVGRTDLPGGSWNVLEDSIHRLLLSRPDDAVILPGHGRTSTIGAERTGNPFLAA
ncbi:MAG: MBL fold metallo-hydrolase [Actinomycetota bacterium]|nr:MBL fold metallo-hydrolase [Actinomycetota bacterium]